MLVLNLASTSQVGNSAGISKVGENKQLLIAIVVKKKNKQEEHKDEDQDKEEEEEEKEEKEGTRRN